MKNWIKVIFALNSKLDALTYSIDGQVECLSSIMNAPAAELFDSIIRLNDKKVRLINLRVLHDNMKSALSSREHFIITRLSRGDSFASIADALGSSKGHVYRIYIKIVAKLSKILKDCGYDAMKLSADYQDIALVDRTYKKFARECREIEHNVTANALATASDG